MLSRQWATIVIAALMGIFLACSKSSNPSSPANPALLSPMQYSPVNSASSQPIAVELKWTTVPEALLYEVQVSLSSTFSNVGTEDSLSLNDSESFENLITNATYFWRVRCENNSQTSAWSRIWSFSTLILAPTPVFPHYGAINQPLIANLAWNSVNGSVQYSIQVSTSQSFGTTIYSVTGLNDTFQTIGPLSNSTSYYWRVNVIAGNNTSAWSALDGFSTIPLTPVAPALVSPTNVSTNVPFCPALSWSPVAGATTYHLQLSTNQSFLNTIIDNPDCLGDSLPVGPLALSQIYFWRLNAQNAGGTSAWSEVWGFSTTANPIPTNGMVAYYPFNGNANDESGNGNNGTVNGATLTQDRFGNNNAAYYFDGVSNSISTSFVPPNVFSISLWYFNYANSGGWNLGFFSTFSTNSYHGMFYADSADAEYMRYDNNGLTKELPLIIGSWVHVVIVSNGSTIAWYRNGILDLSLSGTTTHANTIVFGRSRFNGDYKQCDLDDIRIYNRPLDSTEIQALYHEGGWTGN